MRPWTLTPTATIIHASCLGADTGKHQEASAEDLRRYAEAPSLDDLCGNKSELLVGSVWNLRRRRGDPYEGTRERTDL